ncbi:YfhE family protein [Ureibacillus sp. 179-F W5.1 NHS]|uniref:YfhE family protein n=1 Tax=Lysinibacillus halotolerans TaxID=1368476 RepID=A0A3M8H6L9_9BACI|nr:YfhE family protein [Lysinibacillus halotolerans]RNC98037.1 YfhE family protein [Lysinibacillus halotolerans]
MGNEKAPHEQLTTKDNGLTSTQEVLYRKEFKRADKANEKNNNNQSKKLN